MVQLMKVVGTYHEADDNKNNIIEITELINYIGRWKIGNVGIESLIEAIGYWKAGGY